MLEYKRILYERKSRPGFFTLGSKVFERQCVDCSSKWFPESSGSGQRNRCALCYPLYRQAVKLYHICRIRAAKKNIKFDLSILFILEKLKNKCQRTNLPFIIGSGTDFSNRHPQTSSIDKIDPSGGYTKDNVQIVCWWYNSAKQRYTDREVLEFCKAVVNSSAT